MMANKECFELACGQRWLLHLLEQSPNLARPVQRVYRLSNPFDPQAFLEAFQIVIDMHPALKLQLVRDDHGWKQCFPNAEANISGEEIQGRTLEARAAYASMLIAEEAKSTLDLETEPPVKVKIIRVDGDYLLSVCIDHLVADEIAFDLFEKALTLAYTQVVKGEVIAAIPPDEFFNYLSKEAAQQNAEKANLLFWQQQLKDAPANGLDDEITWVPASVWNYEITGQDFQLLLDFCKRNRCSLFHAVIALQLLLLDKDDVVLNIPVSNRARANEKSIIANLSMLLHVRFAVIRNEPMQQLVLRVRDTLLTAMAHRQYDYPSLSRFIATESEKRGGWLIGCNFIIENEALAFPNFLFEERLDNQPGRVYDMPRTGFTLVARQTESALRISIDWDASYWPMDMEAKFLLILQQFI